MSLKLLSSVIAAAALFAASASHAATVVTLNPQANNGGAGVIDATEPAFMSDGFLGSLGSVLTIGPANMMGQAMFSETGRIAVSDFQLNNANLNTNVANTYNIFADFVLTGAGQYSNPFPGATQYSADSSTAVLSFTLGADTNLDGIVDIALGSGGLDNSDPAVAFAFLFTPGNRALTSFSATINFTPAPGTTGANGFFQAPNPFSIDIFAGNVGGTTNDTTYVGTPATGVVITTVGGSGNFDFVQVVPEPGALALAGLALVGAAVATRRKQRAQV